MTLSGRMVEARRSSCPVSQSQSSRQLEQPACIEQTGINVRTADAINPLKCSDLRQRRLKVFSAILTFGHSGARMPEC